MRGTLALYEHVTGWRQESAQRNGETAAEERTEA